MRKDLLKNINIFKINDSPLKKQVSLSFISTPFAIPYLLVYKTEKGDADLHAQVM